MPEQIDALISKLNANSYTERTLAAKELQAIGDEALKQLREAVKGNSGETVRQQALALIHAIRDRPEKLVFAPVKDKALAQRIDGLIEQLDNHAFKVRSEATKQLEAIGEPAMYQLAQAAKGARSAEAALLILHHIRDRLEKLPVP
jgi:HEAT repeat protein